ncbi:MAG TPA: hypothetical protein VGC06_24405 [Actinomycetes bacterium]
MLAAKLLGKVGDVRRFPTKHHFAPTPARRRWRPQAARSSAIGCHGPATAAVYRCLVADRREQLHPVVASG